MESYKSEQMRKKSSLDFHHVYYPNSSRKEKKQNFSSNKSKSYTTVLKSPDENDGSESFLQPRAKVSKHSFIHQSSKQKDQIMRKYKQKVSKRGFSTDKITFKNILSPKITVQQSQKLIQKLPSISFQKIEEAGSKNFALKQNIDFFNDEKKKINYLLSSNKQSDQTKLTYLQVKNHEINQQISQQINQIYNRYFRKQYENSYGKKNAFLQFEKSIKSLVQKLSEKLFTN